MQAPPADVSQATTQPATAAYVAALRERFARELEGMPPWATPPFWERVRQPREGDAVSPGLLVHFLWRAKIQGDQPAARELFLLVLERTEAANRRWAAGVAERTPGLRGAASYAVREDLRQELTFFLWERLGSADAEPWALFFWRSLAYAQRHVASAYMERNGHWVRATTRSPTRGSARLLSALAESLEARMTIPGGVAQREPFTSAELADLRALVLRLPPRERVAVVLRFWQQSDEREIATALGGVTTRTVRNVLQRAYARLRVAYLGAEEDQI